MTCVRPLDADFMVRTNGSFARGILIWANSGKSNGMVAHLYHVIDLDGTACTLLHMHTRTGMCGALYDLRAAAGPRFHGEKKGCFAGGILIWANSGKSNGTVAHLYHMIDLDGTACTLLHMHTRTGMCGALYDLRAAAGRRFHGEKKGCFAGGILIWANSGKSNGTVAHLYHMIDLDGTACTLLHMHTRTGMCGALYDLLAAAGRRFHGEKKGSFAGGILIWANSGKSNGTVAHLYHVIDLDGTSCTLLHMHTRTGMCGALYDLCAAAGRRFHGEKKRKFCKRNIDLGQFWEKQWYGSTLVSYD